MLEVLKGFRVLSTGEVVVDAEGVTMAEGSRSPLTRSCLYSSEMGFHTTGVGTFDTAECGWGTAVSGGEGGASGTEDLSIDLTRE